MLYDGSAVSGTSGTPQHVSVSTARGNPTTISSLVAGSTTLSRTLTYFATGNVQPHTFKDAGSVQVLATATDGKGGSTPFPMTLTIKPTLRPDGTIAYRSYFEQTDRHGAKQNRTVPSRQLMFAEPSISTSLYRNVAGFVLFTCKALPFQPDTFCTLLM